MRPAWSIIGFTTLAGLAQGFFLAVLALEVFAGGAWRSTDFASAVWFSLTLLGLGLAASVAHLGQPLRGWRAASQWRTSWLSREVIVLPALMAAVGLHALLLQYGLDVASPPVRASGLVAALLCLALWLCTGMIYAALRMIREWATVLTPWCFAAIGMASGTGLAAWWFSGTSAADATLARHSLAILAACACAATLIAAAIKGAWLRRCHLLRPRSTLQSALGIAHPQIRQLSMGMTGGGFNQREFLHRKAGAIGRWPALLMALGGAVTPLVAYAFAWQQALQAVVPAPTLLLALGLSSQLLAVLLERWLFFACVQHPQNLYYQRKS